MPGPKRQKMRQPKSVKNVSFDVDFAYEKSGIMVKINRYPKGFPKSKSDFDLNLRVRRAYGLRTTEQGTSTSESDERRGDAWNEWTIEYLL